GHGQPEFAYTQGRGGPLWREGGWLAVEPVHRALHSQARQLAEPGGDRDQHVFPAMSGQTPDWRPDYSAEGNSGVEPPDEPRPGDDPMEVHPQTGSAQVWLRNHAVTVLGEKTPAEVSEEDAGPASLKTKTEILKYLNDSFSYVQKAIATVDGKNVISPIKSPF